LQGCGDKDVSLYVDPNIGSVAPLLTTKVPTVHRPNSMVRVFPLTRPGLNDRYLSDRIYGFALNMPAYRQGYLTEIMSTSGRLNLNRNESASLYDHDLEEVHPWYHKVILEDYGISADWTTTERTVIYRFDFNNNDSCNIIFRSNDNAGFKISGNNAAGVEETNGSIQYFHAEFSSLFDESGHSGQTIKDRRKILQVTVWACLSYQDPEKPVEVRIGISYIDEEQAAANLHKETADRKFESIRDESHKIWKESLGKIRVEGGTERQKRIFYTSLYRSMERMVNISEDGRYYSGYDKKVHSDDARPFYVDDWLRDTYRSLHPLMLILDPRGSQTW
jgi:predicted alpha-1,2-mannosidase